MPSRTEHFDTPGPIDRQFPDIVGDNLAVVDEPGQFTDYGVSYDPSRDLGISTLQTSVQREIVLGETLPAIYAARYTSFYPTYQEFYDAAVGAYGSETAAIAALRTTLRQLAMTEVAASHYLEFAALVEGTPAYGANLARGQWSLRDGDTVTFTQQLGMDFKYDSFTDSAPKLLVSTYDSVDQQNMQFDPEISWPTHQWVRIVGHLVSGKPTISMYSYPQGRTAPGAETGALPGYLLYSYTVDAAPTGTELLIWDTVVGRNAPAYNFRADEVYYAYDEGEKLGRLKIWNGTEWRFV